MTAENRSRRNRHRHAGCHSWSRLAATYDGTTMGLYVNGTQVATRSTTGSNATSASSLVIGGNSVWGEWFAGLIDDVRIYDRALTAPEVAIATRWLVETLRDGWGLA